MLRIERSSTSEITFALSGHIEVEDVAELQRLLDLENADHQIALNLRDVTLIDRAAVKFLGLWEAGNIRLENCPAYIREWISTAMIFREREVGSGD
jgi:ABC-type transporter Mla MlaB component